MGHIGTGSEVAWIGGAADVGINHHIVVLDFPIIRRGTGIDIHSIVGGSHTMAIYTVVDHLCSIRIIDIHAVCGIGVVLTHNLIIADEGGAVRIIETERILVAGISVGLDMVTVKHTIIGIVEIGVEIAVMTRHLHQCVVGEIQIRIIEIQRIVIGGLDVVAVKHNLLVAVAGSTINVNTVASALNVAADETDILQFGAI